MENNRCPGCMELKSGGAVCEHCGFDESRKNAPHQLQIGTVLQDKYLVGRALGQGGFGITYLGWNRYLDTKVAIKEYYPSVFVDRNTAHDTTVTCRTEQMEEYFTENRIRFLREAKVLAKLKEVPQIVSILDFFEANNTAYIVMEYLQGYDLKAYIRKKGGRLSPTQTFNIMRPVMAALAQVHEAGLVHRDISPDNIMLQPDGSVKLMDFGAVRSVHNAAVDKELTEATQAIVKHGFAPMEQYSATGAIGPWTDEYALCATMYYCMTGKVPQNVHDRLEEDKDVDWDSIEGLTETQREILRKGIALRAKDRYRSIREMMDALFAQPKPEPKKRPARRKKKWAAVLAIVACAVIAFFIILNAVIIPNIENHKKYNDAVALLDSGNKIESYIIFLELNGYKDSAEKAAEIYKEYMAEKWKTADVGDYITFGAYEQDGNTVNGKEEIEWLVLDRQGSRLLLISRYGLEAQPYNVSFENITWETCSLRKWLNSDFMAAAFSANEQSLIPTVTVSAGKNPALGTNPGNETQDQVFLLSAAEAAKYFNTNSARKLRPTRSGFLNGVAYASNGNCWWWLRSPGSEQLYAIAVDSSGNIGFIGDNVNEKNNAVRPALWIDLNSSGSGGPAVIPTEPVITAPPTEPESAHIPPQIEEGHEMISTRDLHTVGLKADGTVVAVGYNGQGQCNVSGWRDIVAVSAGGSYTVGLKTDGTVVAVGSNEYGQCEVSGWKDIVAISTGYFHTVGLKADGTVVAVGSNGDGRCEVSGWKDIVAISAGGFHTVGLKADGTVVAVGDNSYGPSEVSGWRDIVAVSAGNYHTVGLKADGTVVAVGWNEYGRCDVSGWRDIVAVSAGGYHTVGLKVDGTVVAVGKKGDGQSDVSGWSDIVAISAGEKHTVGLKADGTVVAVGWNVCGRCDVSGWRDIRLPQKPKETS